MVHTDEPGERRAGGAVSAGERPDDVPRPGENHPPRVLPAGVRRFAQDCGSHGQTGVTKQEIDCFSALK